MINLKIKDTDLIFNLPIALNEICLDDGLSIQVLIEDKEMSEYDKRISILNILTKCPVKTLLKIREEQINAIYDNLPYLNNLTKIYYRIPFKIDGVTYELKNFNEFKVKEFIEIEFNFKQDVIENIPKNIILLTHKKSGKQVNIYSEELLLKKLDYSTALGVVGEYTKWRTKIQKEFLLGGDEIPEDYVPEPENKFLSVADIWSWYHIINQISSSRQEFDYWMDKNIRELFLYLAYLKQRNHEIKKQNG